VGRIRQPAQICEAKTTCSSILSALQLPNGPGYRCGPPVSGRLSARAPPVRGFFPQIPLPRVRRCAASNPLLLHPSRHLSACHCCCRAAPPVCTPPRTSLSSCVPSCRLALLCQPSCFGCYAAAMPRARSLMTSRAAPPPHYSHCAHVSSRPHRCLAHA
jgi:hypothetical protein